MKSCDNCWKKTGLQFKIFKDTGVIESLIRINRTIRTLHVRRVFLKISDPNADQSSDISLLHCEKNLLLLFFCQHFVSTLSMHSCTMGKDLFLLSPKFQASGFLLPGILHPLLAQDQLLPVAPYTKYGVQILCQNLIKDPSIPCPSLLDGGQFSHLLVHPLQLVIWCLSHREGGLCPSLRELHQALETGRMCQELSFKLALQICPCSVQHYCGIF